MTFGDRFRKRLIIVIFAAGIILLVTLTFLGPLLTSSPDRLAKAVVKLYRLRTLLVFVWTLSLLSSFGLRRVFRLPIETSSAPIRKPLPRWLAFFFAISFVFIVARSFIGLKSPLEWDEYNVACALFKAKFLEVANPFLSGGDFMANTNQIVTNVASFLTIRVFGLNSLGVRFPAVLFTIAFCALLWTLCRKHLSAFASVLLVSHLVGNFTFGWYSHSSKGYISLLCAGLAMYLIVLELVESRRSLSSPWTFFVSCIVLIFAHTLGAVYLGFAFLATLTWASVQTQLSEGVRSFFTRMLWMIPIAAAAMIYHLSLLGTGRHELFQGGMPVDSEAASFLNALGYRMGRSEYGWALLVTVFVVVLLSVLKKDRAKLFLSDFKTIFLGTAAVVMTGIIYGMQPGFFRGRWFLVFLVPVLAWLGESISKIEQRQARYGLMLVAALLLVAIPFGDRSHATQEHLTLLAPYHQFIADVKQQVSKTEGNCYTASGDGFHQERWTKMFYFPGEDHPNPQTCLTRYHIDFNPDVEGHRGSIAEKLPAGSLLERIVDDKKGRTLYRVSPPSKGLATPTAG